MSPLEIASVIIVLAIVMVSTTALGWYTKGDEKEWFGRRKLRHHLNAIKAAVKNEDARKIRAENMEGLAEAERRKLVAWFVREVARLGLDSASLAADEVRRVQGAQPQKVGKVWRASEHPLKNVMGIV